MISLRTLTKEATGWAGALLTLSAFGLNSINLISSQSSTYLLLNLTGSFCLILYANIKKAHASWVLNTIWLLMTTFALVKVYFLH